MSSVGQVFDNALVSLREKYITRLAGATAELNQFAALCEFEEATGETAATIGRLAHKLSGSGQTLGFPDVSTCAARLETLMQTETPSFEAVAAGARALARACEAAARSFHAAQNMPQAEAASEVTISAEDKPELPQFAAFYIDPAVGRLLCDVFATKAAMRNCATCEEALLAVGSGIALLLVDLDNPECPNDAVAALYRKASESGVAVVAFTANRRSAAVATAVSDGKIDCLLKPFDAAHLYKRAFQAIERHRRIAVVCDDDRIVRDFLKPKFEASGFQVHLANDGEEVIDLARRLHPSVIVLDRSMPKVDGLAALKILKTEAATHDIPVVMLTSKAQPHEVTEGLKSGAAAYMLKPFAPAAVVAKCLEILGATPPPRRD
jgi:DNA-binding response OmpR family regulator/HPt (histidine-containing phosphotransfer) domain-containing protein